MLPRRIISRLSINIRSDVSMHSYRRGQGMMFALRNGFTGEYIHESLFVIMLFKTRADAWDFMIKRCLNPKIYEVEAVKCLRRK